MNFDWLPAEKDMLAKAAEVYAAHGWRVFPCSGKTPLVPGGFKAASCDVEQVRAWWSAHPDARIGWAVPEGWWALDVDRKSGGPESLRRLELEHGALPFTLRQVTGSGGEHWLFTVPSGVEIRQGAAFRPGLDTRLGGRGYLIVAPSTHPVAGKHYRWHTVISPVAPPEWLVDIVKAPTKPERKPYVPPKTIEAATKRERYARAVLRAIAAELAETQKGGRNDALNKAWFRIAQFRDVISMSEAQDALLQAAVACGLSEREALAVMR